MIDVIGYLIVCFIVLYYIMYGTVQYESKLYCTRLIICLCVIVQYDLDWYCTKSYSITGIFTVLLNYSWKQDVVPLWHAGPAGST